MLTATRLLAAAHTHDVAGVLCTLLWIVFIVAIVVAVVGLIMSLVAGATRWGRAPLFANWLYAAAVALIAALLLLFLC
jgi:hypothetical protein